MGVQTTPKLSKDINICLVRGILHPKFSILSVIFGIFIVIIFLHGNSSTFTSRTQAPRPLKSRKPWIPLIKSSFKVTGSEVDIYTHKYTYNHHTSISCCQRTYLDFFVDFFNRCLKSSCSTSNWTPTLVFLCHKRVYHAFNSTQARANIRAICNPSGCSGRCQ